MIVLIEKIIYSLRIQWWTKTKLKFFQENEWWVSQDLERVGEINKI